MCEFRQLTFNSKASFSNLHYIGDIIYCYNQYSKYLSDDFAQKDGLKTILASMPYIWAICKIGGEFMGFVLLDNFIGGKDKLFSAEITVCYKMAAWGSFTRYSAKFFLKKCFDELGLYKVKASIYSDNYRVKKLLKSSGFKYITTLPSETLRDGRLQDIDIYAVDRSYFYKNKENLL